MIKVLCWWRYFKCCGDIILCKNQSQDRDNSFLWHPWPEIFSYVRILRLGGILKVKVKSLSCVRLFPTLWTVAHQAPPSLGFSRQEYWSGLPFPSPGDLPDPGIEPRSPALQANALTSEPLRCHQKGLSLILGAMNLSNVFFPSILVSQYAMFLRCIMYFPIDWLLLVKCN